MIKERQNNGIADMMHLRHSFKYSAHVVE